MVMEKIWLVRFFQLWFLCLTSVNSHQVEIGFAEAGKIAVSNPQRKIGEAVGFRELGFLGRKTMVDAFSREDELDQGVDDSEENKDSESFKGRLEDLESNEVEHTRLTSKSSLRSIKKPVENATKARRNEEEDREYDEEKLTEEAEKVARVMRNDYKEFYHSRPPANNHEPRHLQDTSKP